MPKIKSQKFYYYMPDMKTAQITCHINSNGDFYIPCADFPEEVLNMNLYEHKKIDVGARKRFSSDMAKQGFLLEKGVSDFEWVANRIFKSAEENHKNQNKEKVILFKIKLHGIMQHAGKVVDGDEEYWQQQERFADFSSFDSEKNNYGIQSMWNVFYRVKSEESESHRYYTMDHRTVGRSRDYYDWKTIAWTQQREDWFKALDESLKKIITSANLFREANPELIEKFIDTKAGGNLLDFKGAAIENTGKNNRKAR